MCVRMMQIIGMININKCWIPRFTFSLSMDVKEGVAYICLICKIINRNGIYYRIELNSYYVNSKQQGSMN